MSETNSSPEFELSHPSDSLDSSTTISGSPGPAAARAFGFQQSREELNSRAVRSASFGLRQRKKVDYASLFPDGDESSEDSFRPQPKPQKKRVPRPYVRTRRSVRLFTREKVDFTEFSDIESETSDSAAKEEELVQEQLRRQAHFGVFPGIYPHALPPWPPTDPDTRPYVLLGHRFPCGRRGEPVPSAHGARLRRDQIVYPADDEPCEFLVSFKDLSRAEARWVAAAELQRNSHWSMRFQAYQRKLGCLDKSKIARATQLRPSARFGFDLGDVADISQPSDHMSFTNVTEYWGYDISPHSPPERILDEFSVALSGDDAQAEWTRCRTEVFRWLYLEYLALASSGTSSGTPFSSPSGARSLVGENFQSWSRARLEQHPHILVLAGMPDPPARFTVRRFLVKWVGASYDEATWEDVWNLPQHTLPRLLEAFVAANTPPSNMSWRGTRATRRHEPRPGTIEFHRLEHGEFPDFGAGNELRPYQEVGVNWLLQGWCLGTNRILSDEMGLGKTVQTVAFLAVLCAHFGLSGPFLIVAPLNVLAHWKREFDGWTHLYSVVFSGNKASRRIIEATEFAFPTRENLERASAQSLVAPRGSDVLPPASVPKFHVLITSYTVAINNIETINRYDFSALVVDEAHCLKNPETQIFATLSSIRADYKLLLTGTPLQNNLEELWSLLHFQNPKVFASSDAFLREFSDLTDARGLRRLQERLPPYILYREKTVVDKTIPLKEEVIVDVELTLEQKQYYRAVLDRNYAFLRHGSDRPKLHNLMMELRKVCNHPFLVKGARDALTEHIGAHDFEALNRRMVDVSGKMILLNKLLPLLRSENHKVLIFSQMLHVLDILEDYCIYAGYNFERLDGSVKKELRQSSIERFSDPEEDVFVFLICTKAGGLGINLTAADTVIIFDSDWNPQNDIQAQARAHRIGQRNAVKVYRLITARTYEQEMFHRASLKLGLGKAVIHGISKKEEKMPKEELNNLIKRGAYFLMEDDAVGAERARKFSEESITSILGRAAVIDVGGAPGASKAQRLLSRASFSFGGDDINISDPSFWDKCLPASAEQALIKSMAPRQRRMTVAYSGNISAQDEPAEEPAAKAPASDDVRLKGTKWTKRELFSIFSAVRRFGLGKWVQVARGAGIRVQDLPMVREALAVRRDLPIGEDPERLPPEPFVTPTGVYHTLEDLVRAAFALLGLCILEADDAGKLGKTSPEEMQRTLYRLETESASRFCGAPLLPVRDDAEVAAVFECPPPFLQLRDKLSSQANTTLKRVPDLTVAAITCLHAGVIHIDPESGPFGIEVPTRPAEQHGTRSGHRSSRRGGRTSGQRRSTRIRHTAGSDAHGSEAENSSDSSDEAREPDVPFPIFDSLLVRAKLPAHWWTPTDDVDLLAFVVSVSGLDKAIISEQNWCPGDAAEASEADVSADGEYVARRASSLLTSVVRECSRRVFENDWPQADTVAASAARAGEDAAQAKPPSSREEEMADEEKLPSRAPRAPVKIVSRRRAAPRQPQRAEEEPAPLKKLDARPPAARERARASSGPLPSRKDVQALLSVLKKFGLVRVADMPVLKAARWRSAHFSGGGSVSECLRDARAQPLPREMPKPALGVYELLSPLAARGASLEAVDAGPENMRRLAEDLQPCTLPPNLPPHFSAFLVPLLLGVFAVAGEHDFAAVLEMPGADGRLVRFLRSVVNDTLARDVARRLAHFELIRARALPLVLKANPKQLLKPMPRGHTAHTPADALTARWTPALDRGLVLGVAVHGVNFDSLWMDPALPFVRASRQVLAAGGKMPRAARAKECLRARPASKWLWRHVVSFASQETTRRKRTSTQSVRRVGVQAVHEPARKIAPAEAPPKIDTSSFDF